MKDSPVPVSITSVAGSLPLAWQQRVPMVAPCHPRSVATPSCHPQVHPEGVPAHGDGKGNSDLSHSPAAWRSLGTQGIWKPKPSLCHHLPVRAELRPCLTFPWR